MILVLQTDSGDWERIEGESAAEQGSQVEILWKGQRIGSAEVIGFKESNRANASIKRFAVNAS